MIDACALYFPLAKLPLAKVFPDGKSDAGIFRSATWFEYQVGNDTVRLNLGHENLTLHLRGFAGYVAQLPNSGAARAKAQALIGATKYCVGVVLPRPVSVDSAIFASLVDLIERFDGFMFVADSIMMPDRSYVVGPKAEGAGYAEDPADAAESLILQVDPNEYRHTQPTEGVDPERVARREHHYCLLAQRGFRCARWLPLYRTEEQKDVLRPTEEIAARLMALGALFLWASAPEDVATTERLQRFIDRNALHDHLTAEESSILSLPRVQAKEVHGSSIGWRLENMWALAWILGFDPAPTFFQGQLPDSVSQGMIFDFLPSLDATLAEFLQSLHARSTPEVAQQEDLFYCAHNAVRSAQQGFDSVPQAFHPVRDGGAIHERRHALTWALSPGVGWDDTDLST